MTAQQPNRAPLDCRTPRCGHLHEIVVMGEHRDRCGDCRPMWPACPWHTKNQTRFRVHDTDGGAED